MNKIVYAGKHPLLKSVTLHAHDSWELVYCTSGSGHFTFDDIILPYECGDIVVIPPFLPHSNHSEEGFTNFHINMTDTVLPFKQPGIVKDDCNLFLLQIFSAVCYHFGGDQQKSRLLLPPYGDLLYGYLALSQENKPISKIVSEIENTIIQNYSDCNFELDTYLQTFPFSYDYLRKLFKKEIGITPHKYLNDKRLQTAAEMLSYGYGGVNNIAEISRSCGFREPLYFSRMFKRKYGVAPSFYSESQKARSELDTQDSDSVKILLTQEDA